MNQKMRIGELAERAGVTPRTIRYYESLGFFGPSEREGKGFRYYTEVELKKLLKIDSFKQMGLSLEEIAVVVPLYFEDSTILKGKQTLLQLLQTHLKEADEKIRALQQFRQELETTIVNIQTYIDRSQAK